MHQCLRLKTRGKKRDTGDVLGQNWAQSWTDWKEPELDTQTYCPNFLKMVLQDPPTTTKKKSLRALSPQNLNIGKLVPKKRAFDDCGIAVSEYILLRNIVKRAEFGFLSLIPKLWEKTGHFKQPEEVLITFPLAPSGCNLHRILHFKCTNTGCLSL